MESVYSSLSQEGLTLGTSDVRVKGSRIYLRDFLSIGQSFENKSPVQSTGKGSQ